MASEVAEIILRLRNEASQGSKAAADDLKRIEDAARKARDSLDNTGDGVDKLGDRLDGLTRRRLNRLGAMLDAVSPAAGEAARGLGNVSDGIRILDDLSGSAGLSLGAMGVAMGAVVSVLAVAGAAWRGYTEEAREAERIGQMLTEMHQGMQPVLDGTRSAVLDLRVAMGELTEEQAQGLRESQAALDGWGQATQGVRARIAELQEDLNGGGGLGQAIGDLVPEGWTLGAVSLAVDGLTTSSAEARAELEQLQAGVDASTASLRENSLAREVLADYTAANTDADEEAKKTAKEEAEARKAAAAAARAAGRAQAESAREAAAATRAQAQATALLDRLTLSLLGPEQRISEEYSRQVAALDALAQEGADMVTVLEAQAAAAQAAASAWTQLQQAQAESIAQDAAGALREALDIVEQKVTEAEQWIDGVEADRVASLEGIASGISAAAGGVQGGVGLLGQAGPAGSIVAASIGFLSAAGQTDADGNSVMLQQSQQFIDGIIAGAEVLGPVLGGLIQMVLSDFLPGLIGVLVDPGFWLDVAVSLVEAIVTGLKDLGKSIWEAINPFDKESREKRRNGDGLFGKIADLFTGESFDSGTDYVSRSGFAMLHAGEAVIPATGAGSARNSARMGAAGGGGDIHLHISSVWPPTPAQVEGLVREVNRQLGSSTGRGLGWRS